MPPAGENRVVLAVCTPLQKLLKYRKTVMMAGINPLLTEYIRFREDVINVHHDKDKMLKKALALIKSGVERVKRGSAATTPVDAFYPSALIIGGGLAGLSVASEIAENGFHATIIERTDKLGGNKKYFNKEESDYLDQLIKKVEGSTNIALYKESELVQLDGYAGNFVAVIETKDEEETAIEAGIIIIATGAEEFIPTSFLYGENPNVITQTELRTQLEQGDIPKQLAMIQCVGSKDDDHPYCSRTCCNQALENALTLVNEGCDVSIYYRDIVSYGKNNLYRDAIEAGVKFIRFADHQYPEVKQNKNGLEITTSDGDRNTFNHVVLSTGIVPNCENNENLAHILGYTLDQDGFFDSDATMYPFEEAIKKITKPFELATNCIFPVGLAHSPRSFEETLLTAKDIAGRALVLIGKKQLPPPNAMYIAGVKESLCMGCGICVDVCPYSARYIDEINKVAAVHPFLCDSCGSCVSICPNDASFLRDFKSDQTIASLDALLA